MAGITSKITSIDTADDTPAKDTLDLTEPLSKARKNAPIAPAAPDVPAPRAYSVQEVIEDQDYGWIKTVTIIAVVLWLVAVAVICFAMLDIGTAAKSYSALQWAGLAALFLGPLLMIGVAAFSLKQLARVSAASNRLANIAHALTKPDELVVGKSQSMAAAINTQVDSVNEKLNAALGRLAALETTLKSQSEMLTTTNKDATLTADHIASAIREQTTALDSISQTFDGRMGALSGVITSHTDKLADAARMAEQKIKEARISVEGATAKINSASDTVRSHTVQATTTLSASHKDIQSLGDIIKQRSDELDDVYKKHAGDLTAMIENLRDEQQNLGAILEERLTNMRDISLSAQASAESLTDASRAGKNTVEALAQSAKLADSAVKARFSDMQDMVKYSSEHAQSISDKAAKRVQDSLELTRKEISRIENDMADLQSRIGHSAASIDLVPMAQDNDENTATASAEGSKKPRWARMKFLPIDVDDEAAVPSGVQDDGISTQAQTPDIELQADKPLELDMTEFTPDDLRQDLPDVLGSEDDLDEPEHTPSIQDAIRRVVPLEIDDTPKKKSGFSLRGLFGGGEKEAGESSLDIAIPEQSANTNQLPTGQENTLFTNLGSLGLSPNAVVDNGCIIEATNSRVARGHDAMSKIVGERLKGPVAHLSKALAVDNQLSTMSIAFATKLDLSIEALTGNREAIRARLESEDGRAYLLIDAALNYGRV